MTLRVALDMQPGIGKIDGIGTYVQGLAYGLASQKKDIIYTPIFGCLPSARTMWYPKHAAFKRAPTLVPRRIYNFLLAHGAPAEIAIGNVDVVHWTNYCSWKTRRAKIISSMHDVAFLDRSDLYSEDAREHYRQITSQTLSRADCIITISNFTAQMLAKHYNWPEDKLSVTYLGGAECGTMDVSKVDIPFEAGEYIVAVGTQVPRKNYDVLLQAYADYCESDARPVKLVIVGKPGPATQQLQDLTHQLHLQDKVSWLGYITNEEKIRLIRDAACMVHPSWYEGFGLPLVEAMACETPVICSNITACPEVVADAGVLCDPASPIEFTQAMVKVLSDTDYANELKRKGLERAQMFTWSACAERTADTYARVAGMNNDSD